MFYFEYGAFYPNIRHYTHFLKTNIGAEEQIGYCRSVLERLRKTILLPIKECFNVYRGHP